MFNALVYDRTLPKREFDPENPLDREIVEGSRSSVKANLNIVKASISEDLTQRANSTITCAAIPPEVKIDDIIAIYDSKGQIIYWGVIETIGEKELHVNQMQSIFNVETLPLAAFAAYEGKTELIPVTNISGIMTTELFAKVYGASSLAALLSDIIPPDPESELPSISGVIDRDVADSYNFIEGILPMDKSEEYFPFDINDIVNTTNLEDYLYDCFNSYSRILIPISKDTYKEVEAKIEDYYDDYYDLELENHNVLEEEYGFRNIASENGKNIEVDYSPDKNWEKFIEGPGTLGFLVVNLPDFLKDDMMPIDKTPWKEGTLFDTYENVSNVSIVKENEDINTVYVCGQLGTCYGAFTLTNEGEVVPIITGEKVSNRFGANKIKYVFTEDLIVIEVPENIELLARKELSLDQFNHKITFDILFDDNNKFKQYKLGKRIKFYEKKNNRLFNSMLTAWSYEIEENSDVIKKARFTLGKARTNLTSKVNKKKNNKNPINSLLLILLELLGR